MNRVACTVGYEKGDAYMAQVESVVEEVENALESASIVTREENDSHEEEETSSVH